MHHDNVAGPELLAHGLLQTVREEVPVRHESDVNRLFWQFVSREVGGGSLRVADVQQLAAGDFDEEAEIFDGAVPTMMYILRLRGDSPMRDPDALPFFRRGGYYATLQRSELGFSRLEFLHRLWRGDE